MTSNNKLHEHVRLYHSKTSDKTLRQRFVEGGSNHIDLSITSSITSKISGEAIATSSKTVTKSSRLPRPASASPITFRSMSASAKPSTLSISMMKAHDTCLSTPPPSPPQTPVHKQHQEPLRKPYLTMNDLFEMFAEKPDRKNRNTIQKNLCSPRSPEPCHSHHKPTDQPEFKSSNPGTSHRPHSAAYSELAHDHKPPATPHLSISPPKSRRQLNTASLTPPATPRSMTAIPEPSSYPIIMVKASIACPSRSPPRSPFSSPKPYMTMNDLFAMFAGKGKRSTKSLNTIHKRMRSPMPDQARITSYFKPAGQPNPTSTNSFKSAVFTSSPCPAPRACFPANRIARTPQYQIIATGETSNQRPKAPKMQSPCACQQEYMAVADADHTNIDIRVGTSLSNAEGYKLVRSSVKPLVKSSKPFKSLNSEAITSCLSSALRPYLLANSKPIVLHVSASIWPLTKQ